MITVNKANPTQGEITSSLTGSTGDGAGLHLQSGGNIELTNGAAQFGTSDFSLEFILNQDEENASESYIYVTHVSGHNRLLIFHDVSDDKLVLDFRNDSSASTKKDLAYDMNQDFGSPTHYVITFDRSGLATLYKNGNSVASVDISALSSIDIGTDSSGGRIGTSSTDGVIGTFYRFRTYNKLLSGTEVQTAFERADVQYGRQPDLVTNGEFADDDDDDWSEEHNWTIADGKAKALSVVPNQQLSQAVTLTAGKTYKIEFEISGFSAGGVILHDIVGQTTPTYNTNGYHSFEFTAASGSNFVNFRTVGTTTLNIEYVKLHEIGCVTDLDFSNANPSISRTIQDRNREADGSASATGVVQVNPILQGNLTSLAVSTSQQAAGVPADGTMLADKIIVANMPTSASGLATGTLYSDSGTIKIV